MPLNAPGRRLLLQQLIEVTGGTATRPRITLLRAPAGYGKSHALAEAISESPAGLIPTPFHCERTDTRNFVPALAGHVTSALSAEPVAAATPEQTVDALAQRITEPTTLVIQRYHRASSPENDLLLVELCERAPLLDLIVVARRTHLLDGALANGRTRIRVFGPRELAYSEEVALALAHEAGYPDTGPLREALKTVDGWPVAVHAILASGAPGAPGAPGQADPDPRENLRQFALQHLEVVSNTARRFLLVASLLDAIGIDQAAETLEIGIPEARDAAHELVELGLLETVRAGGASEFRCRAAVRAPLTERAQRSTSIDQIALLTARGSIIAQRDPITAFRHLCAAEAYPAAEALLARHYLTITTDRELCLSTLRAIPEAALLAHPGFIAAQLKLKFPDPSIPTSTIQYLMGLWTATLAARTRDTPAEQWDLETLGQVMVAERALGNSERAAELGALLDARISREPLPRGSAPGEVSEEFTIYHHEIAVTALGVGDLGRARRHWQALTAHAQQRGERKWSAAPDSNTASGYERQLLTLAHQELAFTELLDGNFRQSVEHLRIADELETDTGARGAGTSWVSAELARAHLSTELVDDALITVAIKRLEPISDRIERWPLQLLAETNHLRYRRGNEWALTHLGEGIEEQERGRQPAGRWRDHLTGHHAGLAMVVGDFVTAEQQLARLPEASPVTLLERARLALFAGDDVNALLLAQSVNEATTVRRQGVDRSLICAVAAWGCGEHDSAFSSLRIAAEMITEFMLTARLWSVPYDALDTVVSAAADAGVVDLRELVARIPEPARGYRYERLTEMELRALAAVAEYGNAKDAAAALFVTPGTIKKHLAAVYRKLRANGRDEAVLRATRMGLLGTVKPSQ